MGKEIAMALIKHVDWTDPVRFKADVEAFVAKLNAEVQRVTEEGKFRPLYRSFGYTMGSRQARIFSRAGEGRSSRVFYGRDGFVRCADSWKAAGRLLGSPSSSVVVDYVLGPLLPVNPNDPKRED
jgi:hypothetical protein